MEATVRFMPLISLIASVEGACTIRFARDRLNSAIDDLADEQSAVQSISLLLKHCEERFAKRFWRLRRIPNKQSCVVDCFICEWRSPCNVDGSLCTLRRTAVVIVWQSIVLVC